MDKIRRAIQVKVDAALLEYGTYVNSYARRFVPIHLGTLRDSMKAELVGPGQVMLTTGNAKTKEYTKAQYYGVKQATKFTPKGTMRHAGNRKEGYTSFQQQFSKGIFGKGRQTGSGDKAMYSRAYRMWRKYFNPQPQQAAMWYDRVLSDKDIMRRLRNVFVGKFKTT